jgi:serine protease Do
MDKRKLAVAAVVVAGAIAAVVLFAPGVRGQEPRDREERVARALSAMDLSRGQVGVTVRDVRPDEAGKGDRTARVAVEEVRAESPAATAGVRVGDLIAEFDGERVRSTRHFSRLVDETPQGHSVKMTLLRGGQRVTLDIAPERRSAFRLRPLDQWRTPGPEGGPAPPAWREFDFQMPEIEVFGSRQGTLGVQVQSLTDQLAAHLGVKHGVLVTRVSADTPGARAGLRAGDAITAIDGMTVEDASDLRRRLRRIEGDREFTIEITRDRKPMTLKARTGGGGS